MVCKVAPKISTTTHNTPSRQAASEKNQEIVDYETALDSAGYGRFSLSALGACIGAFFATGVQNSVMSYVLPAARCELQLTTYQSGLINMAFMGGGVASAFFWGIIGDVYGRRATLSLTLLLDSILLLAQSCVGDYRLLLAARTLNGFLIGGPSTLTFTYLSDLVGVKRRQLYLNLVGISFVAAWLILPATAWLTIPFHAGSRSALPIYSWRLYVALGSIPGFAAGLWILCLPESPRLLNDTNRGDRAVQLIARIHRENGVQEEFKIKKILSEHTSLPKRSNAGASRTKVLFLGVLQDLRMFVSKQYAVKSTLILFVFFANMAAGFGLNLYIPELLQRLQNKACAPHPARLFTPQSSAWRRAPGDARNNTTAEHRGACDASIADDVFTSGMIVGAGCMLLGVLSAGAGGARGVQRAAAACAAATAAASATLAATTCYCGGNAKVAVAAAAVLNAASLNGNVLLMRLLLFALPPKLSGLGVCWGAWWGRVGGVATNLAVGALLDACCLAPFVAVAVLLALSIGGILLMKLDNTGVEPHPADAAAGALDRYISTHM